VFLHNFRKISGGDPRVWSESGENTWFMHNFNPMLGFNTSQREQRIDDLIIYFVFQTPTNCPAEEFTQNSLLREVTR
jgi:hypothetical protein